MNKYEIERENIGQILSKFRAYRGLILFPIGLVLMLFPFISSFLKFDLIKARYTCPELDNADFSLWLEFKRKLAGFKAFKKERVFNLAFDSIEDDLDLLQVLRKQVMMRQVMEEVRSVDKIKDVFACEVEYEEDPDFFLLGPEGIDSYLIEQKHEEYCFKEEEENEYLSKKLEDWVQSFDMNNTPVEVMANGNKGYGSFWNILALSVMLVALVSGMASMGLFNVSASFSAKVCLPSDDE